MYCLTRSKKTKKIKTLLADPDSSSTYRILCVEEGQSYGHRGKDEAYRLGRHCRVTRRNQLNLHTAPSYDTSGEAPDRGSTVASQLGYRRMRWTQTCLALHFPFRLWEEQLRAKKTFAINFDRTGSYSGDVLYSETPLHEYCRDAVRQLSHEEGEQPVQPQNH